MSDQKVDLKNPGTPFSLPTGDKHKVTIPQSLVDLVIPLELDLDHDPDNDDQVRLWSSDGKFSVTIKADSLDAEQDGDKPIRLYTFRAVPPGYYTVSILVGGVWSDSVRDLKVSAKGVSLAGQQLAADSDYDGNTLGTPEPPDEDDSDDGEVVFEEGYYEPNFDMPEDES